MSPTPMSSPQLIFSKQDIRDYAEVSGDFNPIHLSEKDAKRMGFKACVVHGMLVMGRIGAVCRAQLGREEIIEDYEIRFQAPVYVERPYELEIEMDGHELSFHLYAESGISVIKGKTKIKTSR
ncbi:MaoC/PaaZ C-terminal domain-containing protein [Pseudalkalibacillus sp. R45]|uniref:MaoC/PaaZ C-terminal domain-containing protein n=1 Tax=Pseudalkalibacillus sp. R45 TaxID=3457433 RepID=UPI003FCCDBC6